MYCGLVLGKDYHVLKEEFLLFVKKVPTKEFQHDFLFFFGEGFILADKGTEARALLVMNPPGWFEKPHSPEIQHAFITIPHFSALGSMPSIKKQRQGSYDVMLPSRKVGVEGEEERFTR